MAQDFGKTKWRTKNSSPSEDDQGNLAVDSANNRSNDIVYVTQLACFQT
ncbi:hypothetical protein BH23BAC2_BH23BAC2_08090 [soil metagenome]